MAAKQGLQMGSLFRVKHLFTMVSVQLMFSVLLCSFFMVCFSMILQWTACSHDSLARILCTLL